jgi:hypothetical protein
MMGFDFSGNLGLDGADHGALTSEAFQEFSKALEAGYGTDHATLTGGAAIRLESLDATLYAVTQRNEHFKLWQDLPKSRAGATVDEWTRKPSTGGFPGGAFNSELGDIVEATGEYERKTALVKYLMTRRSVSFVQLQQRTQVASQAEEQVSGTLEILQSFEHAAFYGDSAVVPQQFDGIQKIFRADGAFEKDLRGATLDPDAVLEAAETVSGFGRWGKLTHCYLSHKIQKELDANLDPAYRVPLPGFPNQGIAYGSPVYGFKTSFGDIANRADPYVREGWTPFEVDYSALAKSVLPTPPATVALAAAADAATKFEAAHLGQYRYRVCSVSDRGVSTSVLDSGAVTVASGEKVNITITPAGAADQTGWYIYRGRKDDTVGAAADMRYLTQAGHTGTAADVVADLNVEIPGCSSLYLLSLGGPSAVSIRQLLPMTRFNLYPSVKAEVPWAQLLFTYVRVTKAEQCAEIRNVLPASADWKPFQT